MKHLHILGICGTFMGGIAAIARDAGFKVTGCDAQVYPPMSTQLQQLGIELIEGFGLEQLDLKPDVFVIGNVVSRGNPLMEAILDQRLPYVSGPQWLEENILRHKEVLAVSGTHGKTTTSSMLAFILEYAGKQPSFLIGGVPQDFSVSARLTDSPYFVIEADEYDTAFFDKRSKLIHYPATTAILNNLEFDHADIFKDLDAIQTQFHHWIRTLSRRATVISNASSPALDDVLARGCWSGLQTFSAQHNTKSDWRCGELLADGSFEIYFKDQAQGRLQFDMLGEHNRANALAAMAAAHSIGISIGQAIEAMSRFKGVRRRMELRGVVNGVSVYDDFAHHPTAIATTVAGLRHKLNQQVETKNARILAVLEPRSNTMKLGVMKSQLPDSLREADLIFGYGAAQGKDALGWDLAGSLAPLGDKAQVFDQIDALVLAVLKEARAGDHILVMSNGGFGGIHQKLLDGLKEFLNFP